MSDTPTLANLLTQWGTGGPPARQSVYAHLTAHPHEAAAVEPFLRDELNAERPARRLIAAEAVAEVYRDEAAAARALAWVLRQRDPAAAANTVPVLQKLGPNHAGPLIEDFVLWAPDEFRALTPAEHRWAGATAARADGAADIWFALLGHAGPRAEPALLLGLAEAAPHAAADLSALAPKLTAKLFDEGSGYAAGAARWRVTWRVHRDWLAALNPHSPRFENDPPLLALVTEVVIEHLGRRPDLGPLVRDLLARLVADDAPRADALVRRLAATGARGWAALLPLLGDRKAPTAVRMRVFCAAAKEPKVRPLAHHHAHRVLLDHASDPNSAPHNVLFGACEVLKALGGAAGSALPDALELVAQRPDTGKALARVLPDLAAGHPTAAAAVARTLDRLRRSVVFPAEAFAALAGVYAKLKPDGLPGLVGDTSIDPRTLDGLLEQYEWKRAPREARRRDALALANLLGSPRPEVRGRAAAALKHYADQLRIVWPALVAALLGNDEPTVARVLALFGHMKPITDNVATDLTELFREPNADYSARAVVALWKLGRVPPEVSERCAQVLTDTEGRWNWSVPREVVAELVRSQCPPEGFAADLENVVRSARSLFCADESPDEAAISAHVPSRTATVNWNGVHERTANDPEGGLLFLALMSAFGASANTFGHKIYLIKHQRSVAYTGLAEAKGIVERAIDRLGPTTRPEERQKLVRNYFGSGSAIPILVTDLLRHRLNWYRWAGLELLDAWGAPEVVPELISDRLWDRSELVRARARRMAPAVIDEPDA